jgi:lipoic acid synthetase
MYVASGPLVRSSYKAGEFFATRLIRGRKAQKASSSSAEVAATPSSNGFGAGIPRSHR